MSASSAIAFPVKGQALRVYGRLIDLTTGNAIDGGIDTISATVSKDGGAFTTTTSTPVENGTTGHFYLELSATEMNANCIQVIVTSADSFIANWERTIYPVDLSEPTDHWRDATVIKMEQGLMHVIMDRANQLKRANLNGTITTCDKDGNDLYTQVYSNDGVSEIQGRIGG